MNWLWCVLCGLLLWNALRLRAKFRSLPVLPGSAKEPQTDYICVTAPGQVVREETITAAADYARSRKLELLDLVPADAPALELIRTFFRIDPVRYTTNKIALGYTTGYGLLVSRDLLDRSGAEKQAVTDVAGLYRLAQMFKRYAIDKAGIAVAKDLNASAAGNGSQQWRVLCACSTGFGANMFMLVQYFLLLALLVSVLVSVRTGLIALAAYHAQVLLIFAGQKVRPRDLVRTALFRSVLDAWNLCRLTLTRLVDRHPDTLKDRDLRSAYAAELAGGTGRFFEESRDDCPVCGGHELKAWIQTPDMFQSKPGRFTLDACSVCGHIFQNPRLSQAGLEFYYRDYYDGLGAAETETLFQAETNSYLRRAEAVRRFVQQPARWLDVGAAYGHFCCYVRSVFPNTLFDGLDIGSSIDEAIRSRWVDRGFRGTFTETAPQLVGQYDVVSMFHCLEHVPDPAEEIRSAHMVLAPGGLIAIEVPNPECWFGRVFRRFWMPWVQPQHLNLLSSKNLSRLLRENGFEPLLLEGTRLQRQFDMFIATLMFFKWLAPKTGLPWQPPATIPGRLRRVIWVFGIPVLLLAALADLGFAPVARKFKIASFYLMLARRVDISDPAVAGRLRAESRELQFE